MTLLSLPTRWRKKTKPAASPEDLDDEDREEARYKPIEWPLVRRLLSWLAPHRKQYTLAISVGLVYVLLEMLGPKFLQSIIDYGTAWTTGKLPLTSRAG